MRKKLLAIFLITTCTAFAQFDAQLSQYMFNNNAFNPAAVGLSNFIDVKGLHRINMVGMPGGGSTTVFSINSPLKTGSLNHGVGLSFLNDKVGWFSNKAFRFQYAYKTTVGEGSLNLGLELAMVSLGFSGDSLAASKITIGSYHDFSGDNAIPQAGVVGNGFDVGLGVWYSLKNWYAGLSLLHANSPKVNWGQNNEFTQYSIFYATSGLSWQLSNPNYILKPSMLIKSDFRSWQVDLSTMLEYNERFWGGVTIRPFNSAVVLGGFNIGAGLSLGYAYDVAFNRLIRASSGSHEVFMSYSFEFLFSKTSTKHRSIRFL